MQRKCGLQEITVLCHLRKDQIEHGVQTVSKLRQDEGTGVNCAGNTIFTGISQKYSSRWSKRHQNLWKEDLWNATCFFETDACEAARNAFCQGSQPKICRGRWSVFCFFLFVSFPNGRSLSSSCWAISPAFGKDTTNPEIQISSDFCTVHSKLQQVIQFAPVWPDLFGGCVMRCANLHESWLLSARDFPQMAVSRHPYNAHRYST